MIVGGTSPKFATSFWVAARAVRRTGSNLPIEVWFQVENYRAACKSPSLKTFGYMFVLSQTSRTSGSESVKTPTVYVQNNCTDISAFDEVLLLDADNIVLRNPDDIFHWEPYLSTGSLMWKDFGKGQVLLTAKKSLEIALLFCIHMKVVKLLSRNHQPGQLSRLLFS